MGSVDFTSDILTQTDNYDPFGVVTTPNGKFALISGGFFSDEVVVIDIHNPTQPKFVTSVMTRGGGNFGISLANNLLFVPNALNNNPRSELAIVDVSDPLAPFVTGAVDPLGTIVDVSTKVRRDGSILAVAVNADFGEGTIISPGTSPVPGAALVSFGWGVEVRQGYSWTRFDIPLRKTGLVKSLESRFGNCPTVAIRKTRYLLTRKTLWRTHVCILLKGRRCRS